MRNMIFLRGWLAWFAASGKSRADHFISMETFTAFIVKDTMLLLYILVCGERYSDRPFAPWPLGSGELAPSARSACSSPASPHSVGGAALVWKQRCSRR